MKLQTILRELRAPRIPVEIEAEHEEKSTAPEAENGWIMRIILVRGYVTIEHDPFGTGDSPTEFSFTPTDAIDTVTKQPFNVEQFTEPEWEYIDNQAIQKTRGG